MKTCARCLQELPLKEFPERKCYDKRRGKTYISRTSYCSRCRAEYIKEYKRTHKERSYELAASYRKGYYEQWLQVLKNKFGSLSCCECGFDNFKAIQFHHTGKKEHKLSTLMGRKPTSTRIKELDNGILLCANCHCLKHY